MQATRSPKKRSSPTKRSTRSQRSSNYGTSPLHTRSSATKKSKSPIRSHRYTENELNNYLNKVTARHLEAGKQAVADDLVDASDCAYLNKFNNMANSDLINLKYISPTKKAVNNEGSLATASPEKLRSRFGSSKKGSKRKSKSPMRKAKPDMTSLLMDTETRRYVNEYKNQIEYLRSIVYTLDLKLREQDTWKREVGNLRSEVSNGNNAREELRKTLLETTSELKEEATKFNKVILELEGHNSDLCTDLKAANNTVDDIQTKLHSVEVKNAHLEGENNELRVKLNSASIYKSQLAQSRNDYIKAETRHANALKGLGDKIRQLDVALTDIQNERTSLLNENRKLKTKLNGLNAQLGDERINNADLQNELDNLRKKLSVSESACELLKSIQAQRDAILNDLSKVRGANEQFEDQIENLERDIIERSRDIEAMERRNKDDLNKAQKRIRNLEEDMNDFKGQNIGLKKNQSELKNHITSLEQLLCVKEDVYGQLQDSNQSVETTTNDIDGLRAHLDSNTKVTEGLNDKIIELEKCLIYLKNIVGEKDDVRFRGLLLVYCELEETGS